MFYVFRELAISYIGRTDLAHVDPADIGFDAMGKGEDEGKAPEGFAAKSPVSTGFVRSKTDKLMLVPGGGSSGGGTDGFARRPPEARGGGAAVGLGARGATALKGEVAEFLGDLAEAGKADLGALAWGAPGTGPQATADRRHQDQVKVARMKGYEGEACPECGNFTLVRNGTCLKCDTCGGTTGCS